MCDVTVIENVLEGDVAFIVQTMQFWFESCFAQPGMNVFESGQDRRSVSIRDCLGKNAITVIIVHDKNVIVAGAGRDNESTGLVTIRLSGGFDDAGIASLGAVDVE